MQLKYLTFKIMSGDLHICHKSTLHSLNHSNSTDFTTICHGLMQICKFCPFQSSSDARVNRTSSVMWTASAVLRCDTQTHTHAYMHISWLILHILLCFRLWLSYHQYAHKRQTPAQVTPICCTQLKSLRVTVHMWQIREKATGRNFDISYESL